MLKRLAARFRLPDGRTDWSRVMTLFLRALAIGWFAAAVAVWAGLVGIAPGDAGDFAEAGTVERVRAAAFAVLYPVVAVGLWLLAAWGVVVFVAAVLLTVAAALALPAANGLAPLVVAANLACLLGWATLALQVRRNPTLEKR